MTAEEALAREPRAIVIRDRREAMITLMTIARLENATVHGLVRGGEPHTPFAYAVGWNGLRYYVASATTEILPLVEKTPHLSGRLVR